MATRTRNAGELWELEQLEQLEVYVLGFGQDSSGELYVLTTESTGPTSMTGKVHKIVPAQSGDQPQEGQPQGESEDTTSQETPQTEPEATPEDAEDQQ